MEVIYEQPVTKTNIITVNNDVFVTERNGEKRCIVEPNWQSPSQPDDDNVDGDVQ